MHVKFHCPHCEGSLETEAHINGYDSNCPHCGKTIKTPGTGIYPGLIIDDMKIEKAIGRGSMGEVYLATQVILQRRVALKILNSSLVNTPQAIERFMKEVRLLAKLTHPNIVSAYSAGDAMGVHYLAMSYVKGETMAARLARKGKLPEEDALAVALCVARALNYAWERHHLLHRDIKPGNVMVDEDGEIKLMDMGLSKSLLDDGEGTQTGMLLGTPHYMSPEQADCRQDIDCRADIYGLGATLYHMLTGSPPYAGSSVPEILDAQMKSALTPARERNPQITRATEALLQKMMQKDRAKRHQTWDELIADISQILIEEFPESETEAPFRARQTGRKEELDEKPRRRGILISFLLILLAGLGGFDLWLMKKPDEAAKLRDWAVQQYSTLKTRFGSTTPQPADTNAAPQAATNRPPPAAQRRPLLELVAKRLERSRKNNELPPLLAQLPADKIQAIIEAMNQLDAKVQPVIAQGRYVEAAKLYEDYKGPFASETLQARRAAARSLLGEAIRGTNEPSASAKP